MLGAHQKAPPPYAAGRGVSIGGMRRPNFRAVSTCGTRPFSFRRRVQFGSRRAILALMASSGFPADRLDVLQRLSSASLWSRDPEYRSGIASVAGYARLLTAERDERGRFKRAMNCAPKCAPTCSPQRLSAEWWMAL